MTRAPTPARPSPHYKPPKPRPAPPAPAAADGPLDLATLTAIEVAIIVLAALFGLHPDQVRNIMRAGDISKTRPGYVNLGDACKGILRHYKGKVAASTQTAGRSRLADVRGDEIALRIAEKKRDLVPIADAQLAIDLVCRAVKDQMTGLAARTTRDPALQRQIAAEVNASLLRITNSLTASVKLLRTGEVPGGFDAHDG